MTVVIRDERPGDAAAVRDVNQTAFGTGTEAALVDVLRRQVAFCMSLVAEIDGQVVGHIIFSPVILGTDAAARIMGLGPMSVLPGHQRRGIGSRLVAAGLERCRDAGVTAVVVLGHAAYYPRMGFRPASQFGLTTEFDVPDEVFMAIELVDGALTGKAGQVRYHAAFSAA